MSKPAAAAKYVALSDPLYDYLVQQRSRTDDPLLAELRTETESLGEAARMLISPEPGDFLTLLARLLEVRTAVEIGTFTGYSSICLARGLGPAGHLFCFDVNAEWTAIAQRYWKKEGVAEQIALQLGDAQEVLRNWEPPAALDLVFVDANKPGYDTYFEILLLKMKPNGLFIFDKHALGRPRHRAAADRSGWSRARSPESQVGERPAGRNRPPTDRRRPPFRAEARLTRAGYSRTRHCPQAWSVEEGGTRMMETSGTLQSFGVFSLASLRESHWPGRPATDRPAACAPRRF